VSNSPLSRLIWGVGLVVFSIPRLANAQASLQVPIQFDFLNPGARSLALGGAFTGLADDATAAFTNPAGLPQLRRPEVSFEGRFRHLQSPFLQAGRLSGTKTGVGIDTVDGPVYGSSTENAVSASYLSVVYPKNNWAVAAYRHELVRLNESFSAQGVLQLDRFGDARELPLQASRDLSITTYGISGAYRLSDQLSLGAGVIAQHLSLESTFQRFIALGSYGPPDFTSAVAASLQNSHQTGAGFNLGVQWTLQSNVRVGAVYRHAPSFDFQLQDGDIGQPALLRTAKFNVPNTLAIGAAVRLTDVLMVTVDYDRVQYSRLSDGYVSAQAALSGRTAQFVLEDGNEVHAGVEYVLSKVPKTPALRVGAWYDPGHSIAYVQTAAHDLLDERFAAYLPAPESRTHLTFGAGLPISPRLEFNVGADLTMHLGVVSASAVFRF
jgi:long-chain fatty acid transport protein